MTTSATPEEPVDSVGGIDRILEARGERRDDFAKQADEAQAGHQAFLLHSESSWVV